jgi:hypothetical protein
MKKLFKFLERNLIIECQEVGGVQKRDVSGKIYFNLLFSEFLWIESAKTAVSISKHWKL